MQIGLAGAGRMGAFHGEVLAAMPGVDLVVADAEAGRAKEVASRLASRAVDRVEDLLELGLDALVIASPTPTHAELILRGVEAGCAVFCEKPIALDIETTNEVVEEVARTGAYVQIGFNRRFDPGFLAAHASVAKGELGRIFVTRMGTHDPAPPPLSYLQGSGGLFRDMHIHDFDALRFVTGREVQSVYADGAALTDPAIGELGDVDTTAVVLRLDDGGIAVLTGCRRDPRGYDVRVELFGELDSVTIGIEDRTPLRSVDEGGLLGKEQGWEFFLDRFDAAYREQMRVFVQRAQDPSTGPNPCTVEDGREALLLAMAAERSVAEARPVTLAEIRAAAGTVPA